jgi:hypothetical protein
VNVNLRPDNRDKEQIPTNVNKRLQRGTSIIPYIKIDYSSTENKMLTHEKDDLYVHMENVLCVRQNQGDPCKSK